MPVKLRSLFSQLHPIPHVLLGENHDFFVRLYTNHFKPNNKSWPHGFTYKIYCLLHVYGQLHPLYVFLFSPAYASFLVSLDVGD